MKLVIITGFATIAAYFYYRIKKAYRYWLKKNVPYLEPKNFLMGNSGEVFLNKVPLTRYHQKIYNELAPHKYGGYYNFQNPMFILRDPELIKHVLTKDFAYFMNRSTNFVDKNEPLTMHLFNMTGEEWKILRSKLTPTFTSGKMKLMFGLMNECVEELVRVLNESIQKNETDIEMKDLMARYTTDVISSCAFGIKSNSLADPDSIFRKMGKKIFEVSTRSTVIGFLGAISPRLRRMLGLRVMQQDVSQFFVSLVRDTLKYRQENKVVRNDFINLIMKLMNESNQDQNANKLEFTDDLVTAQCFVFFVAGFETSSGTLGFTLYELATHPDIQDTLRSEIDRVSEEHDGHITFEALQKMNYMDQVVNETLRMYPILPMLLRVCNENYQIPGSDIILEKNTRVIIPVYGLHYDPQHYEKPDEFDPSLHFSEEAKATRHHYTYLPFGEGPRVCIGMRFGLMQVKLGLSLLLRNFEFSVSDRTEVPIKLMKKSFLTTPESGIWLRCKKRIVAN